MADAAAATETKAEPNYDNMTPAELEQAVMEAVSSELDASDVGTKADDEPPEAEAAPTDSEQKEGESAEPEAKADDAEEKKEGAPEPKAWIALKKQNKALKAREQGLMDNIQRLEAIQNSLAQREKRVAFVEEVAERLKTDPEEALKVIAKHVGADPNRIYEKWTNDRLGMQDPGAVHSRLEDIERRLQDKLDAIQKENTEARQREQQAQHQHVFDLHVAKTIALKDSFPALSALEDSDVEAQVRETVNALAAVGKTASSEQIMKFLDNRTETVLRRYQEAIAKRTSTGRAGKPEGDRQPASQKPGGRTETGIHNTDANSGAPQTRLSKKEQDAEATRLLEEIFTLD